MVQVCSDTRSMEYCLTDSQCLSCSCMGTFYDMVHMTQDALIIIMYNVHIDLPISQLKFSCDHVPFDRHCISFGAVSTLFRELSPLLQKYLAVLLTVVSVSSSKNPFSRSGGFPQFVTVSMYKVYYHSHKIITCKP